MAFIRKHWLPLVIVGGVIVLIICLVVASFGLKMPVLDTSGFIAHEQRELLIYATLLMLVVVLPVFIMTFHITRTYRDGSSRGGVYDPAYTSDKRAEAVWWGAPLAIIIVLSVMIWSSSHALDPYKPLSATSKQPITVQAVALQWKWLFIYPEENLATINYLRVPTDTPINLRITADAPMNSLWIPALGGQVYAMAGMETKLHLIADKPGRYDGMSANISGEGFAKMRFKVDVGTQDEYDQWLRGSRVAQVLTYQTYSDVSKPSIIEQPREYAGVDNDLYDRIMAKYMAPVGSSHSAYPQGGH